MEKYEANCLIISSGVWKNAEEKGGVSIFTHQDAKNSMRKLRRRVAVMPIFLAVFGIALAILSRRITRSVRKTKDIADNDGLLVGLKITGLVMILIGLILMIIPF